MSVTCDHKSVGILVWRNDKLLLIERKNFPFGFAPPAGHVDNDKNFADAARRELQEEVGLNAVTITLRLEKKMNNPCNRIDGSWHDWKIYEAEITGKTIKNSDEVKQVTWATNKQLHEFALRTESYKKKLITENEWEKHPGLEPVWYDFLKELKII